MKKYASYVQGDQTLRWAISLQSLTCLQAVLLLGGCRSAPSAGEPEVDRTFRQIQEHEAAIAEASAAVSRGAACDGTGELLEQVCSHAESLCKLALALTDADASLRCQAANDACFGARGRSHASCATSAQHER